MTGQPQHGRFRDKENPETMHDKPQPQLHNVSLKSREEIDRDFELQAAYKRGYSDGISHSSAGAQQQRIDDAVKIANDAISIAKVLCLSNVSRQFTLDEVIPKLEQRIALLQAGDNHE